MLKILIALKIIALPNLHATLIFYLKILFLQIFLELVYIINFYALQNSEVFLKLKKVNYRMYSKITYTEKESKSV